jgi:hypothetical protein
MKVEVRTTHGLSRLRAGLSFSPSWTAHEVTDEQLAALRADKVLEVRAPQGAIEARAARVEEVESEASGLRAERDAALSELAQAQARIAELEAELLQAQEDAQRALAEMDAMTTPAPPAPTPTAPQG